MGGSTLNTHALVICTSSVLVAAAAGVLWLHIVGLTLLARRRIYKKREKLDTFWQGIPSTPRYQKKDLVLPTNNCGQEISFSTTVMSKQQTPLS